MNWQPASAQRGFTLTELMVSVFIVAIFLVPAMQALTTVIASTSGNQQQIEMTRLLQDKMNTVLASSSGRLSAASGGPATESVFSDPPGTEPRFIVFVSEYDGDVAGFAADPFISANADAELLWVRVAHAQTGQAFETLRYLR